jgi:glycosyltransferase involved in cell wall biosynthesis
LVNLSHIPLGLDLTVVIPHIPIRQTLLHRAVQSVENQTFRPREIIVATDYNHEGAAAARNAGLFAVNTQFVAFLDDDDWLYPQHLQSCLGGLQASGADIAYPWFDVEGGTDPLGMFGKPFDPDHLQVANYIPVTVVARTQVLQSVGGFTRHPETGDNPCEDWGCWLAVHNAGGRIVHVPERTWSWSHNTGNTSGRGDRW